MRRAEDIKRMIKKTKIRTNPEVNEAVLNGLLNRLDRAESVQINAKQPNIWSIIMKNTITKFAAAAVVIIACLIGLSIWRNTGSSIALGEVLARMEQVKAFRYQWSVKMTGEDPDKPFNYETHATTLESQEYGKKSKIEELDPNGGENVEVYTSPDKRTRIVIQHKQKKYMRIELDDVTAELLWQENSPGTFLKRILECKYKSMGRATIDGIEVEGFQTTDPNFFLTVRGSKGQSGSKGQIGVIDVKVWVDVKTRLPVRYDFTYVNWFDQGDKIFKHGHVGMHDFQWDVPVDAAEFEPPIIPDDYKGTVIKYPAHITEETAIQGLKVWVELLGKYPDTEIITNDDDAATNVIRLAEKSKTPAAMRLTEGSKGLTDDEISNKIADFLIPIRGLAMFWYVFEDNKKDPAYYGKTVTPKDAYKVLMRWKVSDKEYRVIYGDLHAETVTPEKMAELEVNLPK